MGRSALPHRERPGAGEGRKRRGIEGTARLQYQPLPPGQRHESTVEQDSGYLLFSKGKRGRGAAFLVLHLLEESPFVF